jgi:hypothetical protein
MAPINLEEFEKGRQPEENGGFSKMGLHEDIRKYVVKNILEPARVRGEKRVVIRAGDVHSAMRLSDRHPAVCTALRTKMDRHIPVKIIKIEGPPSEQGANFYVTYEFIEGTLGDQEDI